MGKVNLKLRPINRLQSTFSEAELPEQDLPMIYIRPTVDNKIAVWPGHRMELDPRPNEYAMFFKDQESAEKHLPEIQEAVGLYFGICWVFVDNMEQQQGK